MSWILPLPLLLFAGPVALVPLVALVRRPSSAPRLVVEAFGAIAGTADTRYDSGKGGSERASGHG